MKTTFAIFCFLLTLAVGTTAFGCNPAVAVTSENRIVNQNFYGVILNGNSNVILTQGDVNSIRVEGCKEYLAGVETYVLNGILTVNAGLLRNVTVYITMTDVNLLQVNGNGAIKVQNTVNSDMLLLKVVGDGVISGDVRTLSLGMIVNGNGKIYAGGVTGDSFVKVKGDGQVVTMNLDSLRTPTVDIISARYGFGNLSQ